MRAAMVGCIGVTLALVAFFVLRAEAIEEGEATFDRRVQRLQASLETGLKLPVEVLHSVQGLFMASENVSREEFAEFTSGALERYPAIAMLEYAPVVRNEDRAAFEQRVRENSGLPNFQIQHMLEDGKLVRAEEAEQYVPLLYMEPMEEAVLGLDMLTRPLAIGPVAAARETGNVVASRRFNLVEDDEGVYSVALYTPVYQAGKSRTPEHVVGFGIALFRLQYLLSGTVGSDELGDVEFAMYDEDADGELLYASSPEAESVPDDGFSSASELAFAGRTWRVVFSDPEPPGAGLLAWLVLVGGIGLALVGSVIAGATTHIHELKTEVEKARRLGRYTLEEKLGQGGMGSVYLAKHAMLRRPTAVKLVTSQAGEATLRRFEKEVQLTAELSHPNTIHIFDFGRTEEGVFYYAMELLNGYPLDDFVAQFGPLNPARVVYLLTQACSALSEAHDVGLIHRDIKPANLMLVRHGRLCDFVKVLDFGLVKDVREDDDLSLTVQTGTVLGTPHFISPEAVEDSAHVDGRADIYGLGCVAYFLLTGLTVYDAPTPMQICFQHLMQDPVPPSERVDWLELSDEFEALLMACLEKDPDLRPADAWELRQHLMALHFESPWTEADAQVWWDEHGA